MKRLSVSTLFTLCIATTAPAADLLTLDDGRTLAGEFIGGGRASISFRSAGRVERFPLQQVRSLRFDPQREARAADPAEALTNARIVTTGEGLQALRIQPLPDTRDSAN